MSVKNRLYNFRQRYYLLWLAVPLLFLVTAVSANASFRIQNPDIRQTFAYVSPAPNAEFVSAGTTIAVRPSQHQGHELYEKITFTVVGKRSGIHAGQKILADDQHTILFQPDEPFLANERVSVTVDIDKTASNARQSLGYAFTTATANSKLVDTEELVENAWQLAAQAPAPAVYLPQPTHAFKTAPSDLPSFEVTAVEQELGAGYIFIAYFDYANFLASNAYLLILDNKGEPVYYDRLHPLDAALDFKKQPNGLLTYFNPATEERRFYALDNQYQFVDYYEAGNGYETDLHDLQILENGHALLMVYDYLLVDMSQLIPGGQTDATVVDCIIQELDTAKNVVFEWHSWDHISILDSNQNLQAEYVDYIHCNSVEQDDDGNLLISSRHLDEVTKIDRNTGDVIWRLGGSQNEFTFTNDPSFFHQHDARRLSNGNITIFDNGNLHDPPFSRGVEYEVDDVGMKVERVAEFRADPDVFGQAMGSMQRLPGGNSVVGWGTSSNPILTEFSSDGSTVFTLSATGTNGSYRAFRYPWVGYPTWAPSLVAGANEAVIDLYFSWNGATEITSYQIYGGQNPDDLTWLASVPRQGFESAFAFADPANGPWYFQVMPIDKQGQPTKLSNLAFAYVGGSQTHLPIISSGN